MNAMKKILLTSIISLPVALSAGVNVSFDTFESFDTIAGSADLSTGLTTDSGFFEDALGKSGGGNETSFEQTFTVGSSGFTLGQIAISMDDRISGATIGIELYAVSDPQASSFDTSGGDLFSGLSYTFASGDPGGKATMLFDLTGSDQVTLAANSSYGFRLTATPLTSAGYMDWNRIDDLYSGGTAYGSGSEFDFSGGGRDFLLAINAVPEPSMFALIAGCFGFAYVACRRRHV